jgi:hypothetical protein
MEHIDSVVSKRFEVRSGKLCKFCKDLDPGFADRHALDQLVGTNPGNTASSHLTENGYIHHRMLELNQLLSRHPLTAA